MIKLMRVADISRYSIVDLKDFSQLTKQWPTDLPLSSCEIFS